MFFGIIIIKITINIIIIIVITIIIINATFFCHMRKKLFWCPEKDDHVARIGRRGVFLIRAMPERKHAFSYDVFPKMSMVIGHIWFEFLHKFKHLNV